MTVRPAAPAEPPTATQRKHLVLHIEIPGFWADDLDECAAVLSEPDPPTPDDRLFVVTEEWMREKVGVTLVSIPGEKCMSDDFEVKAFTGRIVGADTRPVVVAGGGGRACCDLHGRNCEPPSELCCENCTEVHHGFWDGTRFGHLPGEICSNPDLSGGGGTEGGDQ